MILKGIYQKDLRQLLCCDILIENGILHNIEVPNAKQIDYFSINPKENADFKLYKLPSKKGFVPINMNYKIEYENENGEIRKIYLALTKSKMFRLNWIQKRYWIQKTDNWIKFLIPIVTGIVVFMVTKQLYKC